MTTVHGMQDILDAVAQTLEPLTEITVFESLPSTNTWLADNTPPAIGTARAALALHQTAGRGQRSRTWVAPSRSGLCLSIGHRFAAMPDAASALTLGLGVAVNDALRLLGMRDVHLKWPNDLVRNDQKLGGILVESRVLPDSSFYVIAGIGINHRLPDGFTLPDGGWARSATDVTACDASISLTDLAATVLEHACLSLAQFSNAALPGTMTRFNEIHWLRDRWVELDGRRLRCGPVDATGRLEVTDPELGDRAFLSSGEPLPLSMVAPS
ncbi:MAG: biotin--[acetyl-CoA-carboxylase] ligase [Pseudomonadota bacterium]